MNVADSAVKVHWSVVQVIVYLNVPITCKLVMNYFIG